MPYLLSLALLMAFGVSAAADDIGTPPAAVRAAVEAIVRDTKDLRESRLITVTYGSALGGKRTDMLVADLESPAKPEAQGHRFGTRLWLEQDKEAPHGFRLTDDAKTIDGTILRGDMPVETYEAIVKALLAEMPKASLPIEVGDEDFGGPELPPLGLSVQYFGLIQATGSHVEQWLYFGEVDGVVRLIGMVKNIAIE